MNRANRRRIRRLLSKAGVAVRLSANTRPLDLTDVPDIDPIAAVYESQGHTLLMRVPLWRCLHFDSLAFPGDRNSASPFIQTLIEYSERRCGSYTGSPLAAFYNGFQPTSAAEFLGIENPSCPQLSKVQPTGAPLPWEIWGPEQKVTSWKHSIEEANREHGGRFGYADGYQHFGPVSLRKGNFEFKRLTAIYESIREKGFRIDVHGVENVGVTCLFSDRLNDWKFSLAMGEHRLAALSALGYTDGVVQLIPDGLGGVVQRADVKSWPMVRRGYLSETEALTIFDRIFDGKQPPSFGIQSTSAGNAVNRPPTQP